MADGSDLFAVEGGANSLGTVLDHLQVMLLGDLHNFIHLADVTIEVHHNNTLCALCDLLLNGLR